MGKNVSTFIPIVTAVLALLTFLFGPNLSMRLSSDTDIVLESYSIYEYYPKTLEETVSEYYQRKNLKMADTLRIIDIKNEGAPSKNLRILIKLDGKIDDFKIQSNEIVNEAKLETESSIALNMTRLSKNANVELKVWLRDENKRLEVSYADDISNKTVFEKNNDDVVKKTIFYTIVVVIFFGSVVYLLNNILRKNAMKKKQENDTSLVERFYSDLLNDSLEEQQISQSETNNGDKVSSLTEREKATERLREFVKRTNSDK
ncbi:hypothetical protein HZF08_16260 [Paenibacillus sp. CGMCC 1.16610]|uniref:Capsular polysaccharide biosynthesis protein n=1 Tax=Paenibacillus anseongense TaxID=2682845 RepID=A0ABW9UH67_9BACL|nr:MULTISPECIES: hypothetical protein [Paenibacillus]MBA2939867.1 hypothetical protein [Paenibacillus sp. CGMCC 1.16610]MVQ39527.1 hypothetical protein [Paenibacillus anseongense]